MSGSLAARYIAGLPYDPSLGVGQYARAPNVSGGGATSPGPTPNLSVPIDSTGQAIRGGVTAQQVTAPTITAPTITAPPITAPPITTTQTPVATASSDGGIDPLLLLLGSGALGLLQYLPDAYDAVSEWLSPSQQSGSDALPTPPEQMAPPEVPSGAQAFGMSDQYGQIWGVPAAGQDGLYGLYDSQGRSLGSIDMMQGADDFGDLGAIDPDLLGGGTNALEGVAASAAPASTWAQAIQAAGGWDAAVQAGTLPTDLGLTGTLGDLPLFGDVATGIADLGGGLAGGWIASQPFQNSDRPYAQVGQQVGSVIGGALGTLIPIPFLGTAAGAAIGGLIGGGAGSLPGPAPTIGRNFGSMATIGGDGNFYWGNSGGDNGGSASDADAFTSWFGPALQQQAAQRGLVFNPNMAGAQFNVGGYDNFWRGGRTAGGYFYDPYLSGSPENSALRPADDWMSGGYSQDQANAFTTNVLADLTARGVYTQPGATQPGRDYWASTSGADLGFYGAPGGAYSDVAQGGGDWNSLLSGRQNTINGFLDQQAQERQRQADAQAQLNQNNRWAGMDVGAIPPTLLLAAQNDPYQAANLGLPGVQMGEYGPMFSAPSPDGAPFVYDPGGA